MPPALFGMSVIVLVLFMMGIHVVDTQWIQLLLFLETQYHSKHPDPLALTISLSFSHQEFVTLYT